MISSASYFTIILREVGVSLVYEVPNAHMMQNSAIASINQLCQCREMTDFGNNCELRPTSSAAVQFLDPLIIWACWKCTAS